MTAAWSARFSQMTPLPGDAAMIHLYSDGQKIIAAWRKSRDSGTRIRRRRDYPSPTAVLQPRIFLVCLRPANGRLAIAGSGKPRREVEKLLQPGVMSSDSTFAKLHWSDG
jgi:hypothetical protein